MSQHGGKREGAGRKPVNTEPMVTRAFVITQQQAAWLAEQVINTHATKSAIVRGALDTLIKRRQR